MAFVMEIRNFSSRIEKNIGIELDSVNQVAGVPTEKLSVLKELITSWLT